jgi:threonine/homoserine/homoserine lactone efflux protein
MTVLGISDHGSFCLAIMLFLALPGPGTLALLTSATKGGFRAGAAATLGLIVGAKPGDASPIRIEPRDYARQAFLITLLNPKAIVFYMAFLPLFIDPATHRGAITFAAMAATIALITLAYCLTLCAFAQSVSNKVRRHRRLAAWLQKAAGIFLIGFGIRLGSN